MLNRPQHRGDSAVGAGMEVSARRRAGRPKTGGAKSRIIDAAFEVIEEQGLHGLTLKAVALQCGVSLSLLSYHFRTRERLLEHCAERWGDILAPLFAQVAAIAAEDEVSSSEIFCKAVLVALDVARQNSIPLRAMHHYLAATGSPPGSVRKQVLGGLDVAQAILCQHFGAEARTARSVVHQCSHLIVRLALCDEDELVAVYGGTGEVAWQRACSELIETLLARLNR
jgi:AcrR family transcriptional regulator